MLILVRHGQSRANEENRMCGQLDSPLTDLGREQAISCADELQSYQIDQAFCSDLTRARDTIEIILDRLNPRPDLIVTEKLRERSGGDHEGKTYPELRESLPPRQYKLWQRDYFEPPLGGESMADVADRIIPYFDQHIRPPYEQGKNVLVVSHAVVMKVLLGWIRNLDETQIVQIEIENAIPYVFSGSLP